MPFARDLLKGTLNSIGFLVVAASWCLLARKESVAKFRSSGRGVLGTYRPVLRSIQMHTLASRLGTKRFMDWDRSYTSIHARA